MCEVDPLPAGLLFSNLNLLFINKKKKITFNKKLEVLRELYFI